MSLLYNRPEKGCVQANRSVLYRQLGKVDMIKTIWQNLH